MNSWIRRVLVGLAAAGVFVFFFVPIHSADSGISGEKHLSLEEAWIEMPGVFSLNAGDIPPDGSTWHELWPAFCGTSNQDGYLDNGDECVSKCDGIILDGATWHIIWTGPTYYVTCFPPPGTTGDPVDVIFEPFLDPHNPENPVCENWVEINPSFGQECHIDDWVDNDNSGGISPCDDVYSKGVQYHINDIGFDIIIDPDTGTPTKSTTWGMLKRAILGDGH